MLKLKKNLPNKPGVYFFLKGRKILYIGKATSLRDRVRSYFNGDIFETRGPKIEKMLAEATSVDFQTTDSVLEALILESSLIKKHQPEYNTREKDDKSYNYVIITKEDFPRVLVVRGKELPLYSKEIKYQFGPFTAGGDLRTAMRIIRKIFPFRDKCEPGSGRPCFNAQIGLCPGVCAGTITKKEYGETIKNIKQFFEGKKSVIKRDLAKRMKTASTAKEFELAASLRNRIFALDHINDVALYKREKRETGFRIEAFDIAHISGTSGVGVMIVIENGKPAKGEYKKFRLRGVSSGKNDDIGNLKEVLERRFKHDEWQYPDLVVVDGGRAQRNIAERIMAKAKVNTPVAAVTKDERHKAKNIMGDGHIVHDYHKDILLANAEAHRFAIKYHRELRDRVN